MVMTNNSILQTGNGSFLKANNMTCCRQLQLKKDVLIMSEEFLSHVLENAPLH